MEDVRRTGRVTAALMFTIILAATTCSDETPRACASGGGGEVCLVRRSGRPTIEVAGLQAGSSLSLSWVWKDLRERPLIYRVNDRGGIDGVVGDISAVPGAISAEIVAVATDGTPIEATLSLPEPCRAWPCR